MISKERSKSQHELAMAETCPLSLLYYPGSPLRPTPPSARVPSPWIGTMPKSEDTEMLVKSAMERAEQLRSLPDGLSFGRCEPEAFQGAMSVPSYMIRRCGFSTECEGTVETNQVSVSCCLLFRCGAPYFSPPLPPLLLHVRQSTPGHGETGRGGGSKSRHRNSAVRVVGHAEIQKLGCRRRGAPDRAIRRARSAGSPLPGGRHGCKALLPRLSVGPRPPHFVLLHPLLHSASCVYPALLRRPMSPRHGFW